MTWGKNPPGKAVHPPKVRIDDGKEAKEEGVLDVAGKRGSFVKYFRDDEDTEGAVALVLKVGPSTQRDLYVFDHDTEDHFWRFDVPRGERGGHYWDELDG